MKSEHSFTSLMRSFEAQYNLHTAFEHFLDILIIGLAPGIFANMDKAIPILEAYDDETQETFLKLVQTFREECNTRRICGASPDILGEFYEAYLAEPNTFLPWPICQGMVRELRLEKSDGIAVDHACGSGRILLAIAEQLGVDQPFYGVDCNLVNAKMTAITLCCNGVTYGEIVCANALLNSGSFKAGYRFLEEPGSLLPILQGGDSILWKKHMDIFANEPIASEIDVDGSPLTQGLQIRFW